jgi:hypothetical protein
MLIIGFMYQTKESDSLRELICNEHVLSKLGRESWCKAESKGLGWGGSKPESQFYCGKPGGIK